MRAAYIDGFCGPDGIRYGELADPSPASGQLLVRVEATAVNMVDTFVRSGAWRTDVHFPLAVGRDLVGTVVQRGAGVTGFAPGERVWTNSAGYGGRAGAAAELTVVDADRLYRLPDNVDPLRFVATVHPGATAWGALCDRARLKPGETVAVVGANGAVGQCLLQICATVGSRPIAVIRNDGAAARMRSLGAECRVAADRESLADAIAGADVLVDCTGVLDLGQSLQRLADRGRVVVVAGRGRDVALDLWSLYTRQLQLLGFIMSGMTTSELSGAADWLSRHPLDLGVVQLALADAGRAHRLVEMREVPHLPDGTVARLVLIP